MKSKVKTSSAKSRRMTGRAAGAPKSFSAKPAAGKSSRGRDWEPATVQALAAAPSVELNEPRPLISRWPIPDAEVFALKAAAPKAKLAKPTAEPVRDLRPNRAGVPLANAPMAAPLGHAPTAAPTGSANFAGISDTGWFPPDCTMAAGPDHLLLSVNSSVAFCAKAGGAILMQKTLTQWFSNVAANMTIFDPKALYDQHAGRWLLLAVAVSNELKKSLFLLSISANANPLGAWKNYALDATMDGAKKTGNWVDYPALGVDANAIYLTGNMFAFGGGFKYAKIRVIPKQGPYSGGAAPYFDFANLKNADGTMAFTIQPCHTFGAPQVQNLVNTGFPSGDFLTVWQITMKAGAPAIARQSVRISPYSLAPNADQQGGGTPLNTGDVRALHAIFRGDSIWTAFTTAHNWGGATNFASIQWCQIRAGAPAAVVQQGVFGAGGSHYFFPASCPDNNGNLLMVFSRASAKEFGSLYFTGRRSTDPLGTLQNSVMLKAGVAHYDRQDGTQRNRWGDYCGVAADPGNSRVVWFYNEYASALNTWGTWVGSAFF